eukprot:m.137798 g.137798  ORF g.137798 m.137798 type:complete len:76 (+) comp15902_c0_seq1:1491-1718(+)
MFRTNPYKEEEQANKTLDPIWNFCPKENAKGKGIEQETSHTAKKQKKKNNKTTPPKNTQDKKKQQLAFYSLMIKH